MGCKVFGRREGVPYFVNASAGIEDAVFCMIDSTATSERGVKVATAGATVFDGVVGVVQTGVWHGHYGTAADKYPQNADINVVSNGQVRVKILQTTSTESDYLADGNLVVIGEGGKAAKYAAASVTPSMTANFGNTNVGALITTAVSTTPIGTADIGAIITANAGTWANANTPTAAEVKAYMELVIEAHQTALATQEKAFLEAVVEAMIAAEATLTKAYITEFVSEYVAAFEGGLNAVVGRCVGAPVGGVVCVELIGLGGIQQG